MYELLAKIQIDEAVSFSKRAKPVQADVTHLRTEAGCA